MRLVLIAFLLCLISAGAYAQRACTALTSAATLGGTECFAVDQSGNARQTSPSALSTYVHENELHAVSTKTADYTAALTDLKDIIVFNSSSDLTFTIPPFASVGYSSGSSLVFGNINDSILTVSAGAGVTLYGTTSYSSAGSRFGKAFKIDTDTWGLK